MKESHDERPASHIDPESYGGNERGGQPAAILSSLTSTCRRHNTDPQRYLTQLLTKLPATPISQISQWLPDEWKQRQAGPSANAPE
ncbi:MAG: transposase domain-containing protein [Tepidisphaeraceae bacterium]